MPLSQALTAFANNRSARTVSASMVLEFFDLGVEPGTTQSELRLALKPWVGRLILQWLDDAHAFAVFTDTHARAEVRRALSDQFNMNSPTKGRATEKAAFAFRTAYLEGGREDKPRQVEESKADAAEQWRSGDAWDDIGNDAIVGGEAPASAPQAHPEASWDDEEEAASSFAPLAAPGLNKYIPVHLRTGDDAIVIPASAPASIPIASASISTSSDPAPAPGPAKYIPLHLRAGGVAVNEKAVAKLGPLANHPFDREKSKPAPPSNAFSLLMDEDGEEEEDKRGSKAEPAVVPVAAAVSIRVDPVAAVEDCSCHLVIESGHMEGCFYFS
jgi:hypothetical protein